MGILIIAVNRHDACKVCIKQKYN